MSLKILDEDIKNKKLKGIYLLYGTETYDVENYVEKMKKCFSNLEAGVNFFVLDKANLDKLEDYCESVSFFGLEKLIVIKNTGLKFNKDIFENINNPELVIIITEESVDKRTSEYKYLTKKAVCVEFNKLNEKDAIFFVKRMLNAYKINVSDDVAKYLVSVCTEDKQILINEFRKIVAYLDQGESLTKEIIDTICSKTLDAKIFDLMDCIMGKKKEQALSLLEDMLAQGTYIGIITSMMFKQIKQIYQIKLMEQRMRETGITADIAKELGIHPFAYSKLKAASPAYDLQHLENLMLDFDEYDENSKTGKVDIVVGLKTLILKM
ncbi:MAG: DNA polymerase III subunit delta [Clostridia bacterium]|nr:DNA polymerase III subunit delta [Clostridia bacterium]